jgi:DNA-binding GntR family transcriptional regulator
MNSEIIVTSQRSSTMVLIREMILMGRFAAGPEGNRGRGRRSARSPRTSVRRALPVLDHERLLRKQKRGYVVRSYNDQRVAEALEIMSHLEGASWRVNRPRGSHHDR